MAPRPDMFQLAHQRFGRTTRENDHIVSKYGGIAIDEVPFLFMYDYYTLLEEFVKEQKRLKSKSK